MEEGPINYPKYNESINNYFPLQADRFVMVLTRYPDISYHVTMIQTGNVLMQRVDIPDQNIFKGAPSNKFKTEDIMLEFIVDDQLKNYNTILRWLQEAIHWCFSDLLIYCYDSCKDDVLVGIFTYHNVFPTFLSSLEFKTTSSDLMREDNTIKARVNLTFDLQDLYLLDFKNNLA